jgi:hypothetical protein
MAETQSRFSRGIAVAGVAIPLGALVLGLLGFLASRPSEGERYASAVHDVCAAAKASYVNSNNAMGADFHWDKAQLLRLLDVAVDNNRANASALAAVHPPSNMAARHRQAVASWERVTVVEQGYRDRVAHLSQRQLGSGPRLPGDLSEVTVASERTKSALAAIGGADCGFSG